MRTLYPLVFTAGAVTLGMELSAARLLEPAFGNNQLLWAAIIGLILLYLAVGAWLGGRLADRFPHRAGLDSTLTLAAIGVALVPALAPPVLRLAATGLSEFATGMLAGALLAVLLLFSIPGILLGTATPWALRLAVHDVAQSGRTAGTLFALGTAGSLVGTFLPVLWLIPTFGTRWTFFLLAGALLLVLVAGSLGRRHGWIPLVGLAAVAAMALLSEPGGPIRAGWDDGQAGAILYEDESLYNYIVVRQWNEERHLKLNDGVGIHSVYHPGQSLSRGIWDYFLLAPLLRAPAEGTPPLPQDALIIGLAAGTVSNLLSEQYGPLPITGIELDPQIIQVGRTYFDMERPNLNAIAADGRSWLAGQPAGAHWDLVVVDAYRPPYIPFHLTTVEFFALVDAHLAPDGVVAVNVGRTPTNFTLVHAMAATLGQVFPHVQIIDEPGPPDTLGNSLVVASHAPLHAEHLATNAANLPARADSALRDFAQGAQAQIRPAPPADDALIFRDDRAPVERVVHAIIFDFLAGN